MGAGLFLPTSRSELDSEFQTTSVYASATVSSPTSTSELDSEFHTTSVYQNLRPIPRNYGQVFGDSRYDYLIPSEIEYDPYALDLYIKALRDGKEKDRSIRINVVGNFAQGKTSLVRRLVGESVKGVASTNGIEVDRYICQKGKNGTLFYVKKGIQDTSDISKRLAAVANTSGTNVEGVEESDLLKTRMDECHVSRYDRTQEEIDKTKVQQDDICTVENPNRKCLTGEEFQIFAKQIRKSKESDRVVSNPVSFDIWDFGGQYTFYATHTIFHSRKAIYLLVFNLSQDLNKQLKDEEDTDEPCLSPQNSDMEYFIRFWVNSVHCFVGNTSGTEPAIILVGTHKDKLKGNKITRQETADKYFSNIRDLFDGTRALNHIRSEDFAVDNTNLNDESVEELRRKIIEIGEENAKTVTIPAKWIQLETQLIKNRYRKIVSLEEVMQMDAVGDFPIANTEQIKLFLAYHHNKGTLCYFDEEPLSTDVILDPQYLIDAFRCIITAEKFCRKDNEIRPFWQKLLKEAKLEHALIDRLWGKDEEKGFMRHKDTLLGFLKKHHIISEVTNDGTEPLVEVCDWYIVPSFLRDHSSETEIAEFLTGKQQTLMRYILTFDSSAIVPTVFHRVVAAALGKWPVVRFRNTNMMYKNLTVVRLDPYDAALLELKNETIELNVVSLCPSVQVNGEMCDGFRRFVMSEVGHEFSKLKDSTKETIKPYEPKFRCNHPSHGIAGSINLMEISQLQTRKISPCPDSLSHEIFTKTALSEWFQDSRWIKSIPKHELSDKSLSKLSGAIGCNWELLGLELGLTEVEIQHIIADFPHSAIMRIYKMLREWSGKEAERDSAAMLDVFVQAIKTCPGVTVDWDIIRNVIDEIEQSGS